MILPSAPVEKLGVPILHIQHSEVVAHLELKEAEMNAAANQAQPSMGLGHSRLTA